MKWKKKIVLCLGLIALLLNPILNLNQMVFADVTKSSSAPAAQKPTLTYSTQVQTKGWLKAVGEGQTSGTTGQSLRIEAIKINLNALPQGETGGVAYSAHVQSIGWQKEVSDGAIAGTTGRSLRMEAIKIRLTGRNAQDYSISYRTHVQTKGWTPYVKNNEISGSVGEGLRIEAIEIKLVKNTSSDVTAASEGENGTLNPETENITDADLDKTLSKTQQWLNQVSDQLETQGLNLMGAHQSTTEGLTLTSSKSLNDDYYLMTRLQLSVDGKEAELKSMILQGDEIVAIQSAKGKIEKVGGSVLFKYTDEKTNKETSLDLSAGHPSVVAAVPFTFSVVGGGAGSLALTSAMTAAAPEILVFAGAAALVGGGYWIYTKVTEEKSYPSAAESRAVAAAGALQAELPLLETALKAAQSIQVDHYLKRLTTLKTSYQHQTKLISTQIKPLKIAPLSPLQLEIPEIKIDIPKINLDNFQVTMQSFKQSMKAFDASMADFNKTMDHFTNPKSTLNQTLNELSKLMSEMNHELAKWPKRSASPTFSQVSYDTKTKLFRLEGKMPTASVIKIYIDYQAIKEVKTNSTGQFSLEVPIESGKVTIDALQNSTKETTYISASMVGVLGAPTFTINKEGQVLVDEFTNKKLTHPLPAIKSSAQPQFKKLTYDLKTKTLSLSGSMPSASTIKVYRLSSFSSLFNKELLDTVETSEDGKFSLVIPAKPGFIGIDALQNPTRDTVYTTPNHFFSLPAFKILSDGRLLVQEETNKLLKTPLPIEKESAQPTFSQVTYDSKSKMLTLVGKVPTKATIEAYGADSFNLYSAKKLKTMSTTTEGEFRLSLPVTTAVVAISVTQKSTDKIVYSPLFNSRQPAFKISSQGQIIVEASINSLLKVPLMTEETSALPTFSEVSYDVKNKAMTLVGKMPSASIMNISSSSSFLNLDSKLIQSSPTAADGSFRVAVPIEQGVLSVSGVQNPTAQTMYVGVTGRSVPAFRVYPNGKLVIRANTQSLLKDLKTPLPIEKTTASPVIGAFSYQPSQQRMVIPITMPSASNVTVYHNEEKTQSVETDAKGFVQLIIPIEQGVERRISIELLQKDTATEGYNPDFPRRLHFKALKDGTLTADASVNDLLSEKLPPLEHSQLVTLNPKFSELSFDQANHLLKVAGKMAAESLLEISLNKEKIQSVSTAEDGSFELSIPVPVKAGERATLSINGTQKTTPYYTYRPYLPSDEEPMFTINEAGELAVSTFAKTLIDVKTAITPIPNVSPIPVGKGVSVQGKTLPHSDVIIKNKGVEFKGKADEKGIFSIPVPEVTLKDVLEIFVKAPSTAVISYSMSESFKLQALIDGTSRPYRVSDTAITKLLENATFTNTSLGLDNYVSNTLGYEQALEDFNSLGLTQIKTYDTPDGQTISGVMDNGVKVNVRNHSSGESNGAPTLGFRFPNKEQIKIRY